MWSMSDSLQTIIDRHAAATPGPQFVEVIDDHTGRPEGKEWLICDLARERYGNNPVSSGEDEKTARFVAASFTDVPAMAAALLRAQAVLADMDRALASGDVDARLFKLAADGLRNALNLDGAE
jgi:hypothetical protein